tara:strand:- start:991 stop:1122 length:132 start_codon:yes stop_codon:yes gene_type:complete
VGDGDKIREGDREIVLVKRWIYLGNSNVKPKSSGGTIKNKGDP